MAKKAKKASLPKKVAGVKVPKQLRKGDGSLSSLFNSPLAREVVADALVAIAGALIGSKKTRETVARAGSSLSEAGAQAGNAARDAASATRNAAATATGAVAEVVTEAARRILPASLVGEDEKPKSQAHIVEAQAARKKRKAGEKTKAH